ncbi:DUF3800 domain-containing protein [Niallia sp. JL1B1071]|uniref:DUF3800 domain-containing protein n=1 Tax=Niallia tiangongensis TaxID=3237105 RepID=UPI0037DBFB40
MGIFYIDEAGNTGLQDKQQKLLIYGGPYVNVSEWKTIGNGLAGIQNKYFSIIVSRFQSGLGPDTNPTQFFRDISSHVGFLQDFHFHAKNIVNRTGLWSKLNNDERFDVLEDILDLLIKHNVTLYIGALDKAQYIANPKNSKKKMAEYKFLHNSFLEFLEKDVPDQDQIITIIDDGDITEKKVLKDSLNNSSRRKFFGELVSGKARDYPLLQVADVGIWIFQAFHRLDEERDDEYANRVRSLYKKLESTTKLYRC